MKIINWITAAIAVIAVGVGTAGLLAGESARSQIRTEQAQIRTEQAQVRAAQSQLSTEQAGFKTEQAALIGQVKGTHRDLITCADIQSMISNGYLASYYAQTDSTGYATGINSTPMPTLPHCINQ